jgi:uncharacterized protein (TIGR00730 family)
MADPALARERPPTTGSSATVSPQRADEIFLEGPRSRFDELITLFRVLLDFLRGFRVLHFVGPCVTVFGSARLNEGHTSYELARKMGAAIAQLGFTVMTGGGPGIMEAANRGAHEAGGKTIGLNIRLPFEQGPNEYVTEDLHFEFHYFFMRKFWFAYLAKSLVIFPGGFGTLDEMFEILTLAQTRKLSKKLLVILYGSEYWNEVFDLRPLLEWGAISEKDLGLLCRVDSPEEAFEELKTFLLTHHMVPETAQENRAPGIAKTRG